MGPLARNKARKASHPSSFVDMWRGWSDRKKGEDSLGWPIFPFVEVITLHETLELCCELLLDFGERRGQNYR